VIIGGIIRREHPFTPGRGKIMAMSRKHYRQFAQMISDRLDAVEGYSDRAVVEHEINELAKDMIRTFRADNSAFNVQTFREAAGLNKPGRNTQSTW
jgi:hypothetical protein